MGNGCTDAAAVKWVNCPQTHYSNDYRRIIRFSCFVFSRRVRMARIPKRVGCATGSVVGSYCCNRYFSAVYAVADRLFGKRKHFFRNIVYYHYYYRNADCLEHCQFSFQAGNQVQTQILEQSDGRSFGRYQRNLRFNVVDLFVARFCYSAFCSKRKWNVQSGYVRQRQVLYQKLLLWSVSD